jgi:hypothetical protein
VLDPEGPLASLPLPLAPGVVVSVPVLVPGVVTLPGVEGLLTPVPDELPAPLLPIESVPVVPGLLEGEPMPGVLLSVGLPGVDGLAAPGGVVGLAPGVVGLAAPGVLPVPELPLAPPDCANAPPARTIAAPMVKPANKFFFTMLPPGWLLMRADFGRDRRPRNCPNC